ncbi:MAG TPA: hypothetical protein VF980_08780 [Thermoanaerobaculia bacterium]
MSWSNAIRRVNAQHIARAALLLVFAAATVLPFCTSFFACTMPCCHHGSTKGTHAKAATPACPLSSSDCDPTLKSADREVFAVAAKAPVRTATLIIVPVAIPLPASHFSVFEAAPQPTGSAVPLHLLNETFRI